MRKHLHGARIFFAFAFQADPLRATAVIILASIELGSWALIALWLKLMANGVVRGDGHLAMLGAIGMIASISINSLTNWLHYTIQETLQDKTGLEIDLRLMQLSGGVRTIEHHERPEYLQEMELLRGQRSGLATGGGALAQNVANIVRLVVTTALLASIHPALIALPLFAAPSLWIASKAERLQSATQENLAEDRRWSTHLFWICTDAGASKEVRVFRLQDELVRRYHEIRARIVRSQDRTNLRTTILTTAGWAFFSLGYVGAVVFVVTRAVSGHATPGDVLLAINLAGQVSGDLGQVAQAVAWLQGGLRIVRRYTWLIDHAATARTVVVDPISVPIRIEEGIRLEHVTFGYPGTDRPILENVDLLLPAGRSVAIVGDNGAGKTTLVKLLCRFYDPLSGRITLDGTDIARFDPAEWLRATSGGFQDFFQFELLARESVGVGEVAQMSEDLSIERALERAGGSDVVATLPSGLDTQLGRHFDDGVELSTGQWQKLALGRAMMRNVPLLLVLDEPTASLDAMTEHALFERYASAARRIGEETGSITLLVSHRFSTVRMADLIIVIDGGKVEESGSHAELMENRGLYAELYELQARAYR